MSNRATLTDTGDAISSRESGCGLPQSSEPGGQTTLASGPDRALANLSAMQAEKMGLLMSGTYGRTGSGSSRSRSLQSCLASKLRARTDVNGSILYRLTWKEWVTPQRRRICALRASTARTQDKGFILSVWPTPSARDHKGGYIGGRVRDGKFSTDALDVAAQLAGWPSPGAKDGSKSVRSAQGAQKEASRKTWMNDLATTAQCAGWATPDVQAMNVFADPAKHQQRRDRLKAKHGNGNGAGNPLGQMVHLAGWPDSIGPIRLCSDGRLLTGSSAAMESGGRLDPTHSRWLMRLPPEWDDCAPTETHSMLKRRSSSRKLSLKYGLKTCGQSVYDLAAAFRGILESLSRATTS